MRFANLSGRVVAVKETTGEMARREYEMLGMLARLDVPCVGRVAVIEDNNWRPLTPYDSSSIMHYPQCNGSSSDLRMTATDRAGAQSVYGS